MAARRRQPFRASSRWCAGRNPWASSNWYRRQAFSWSESRMDVFHPGRTSSLGGIRLPGPVVGTERRKGRQRRLLASFGHLEFDGRPSATAEEFDVHQEVVPQEDHAKCPLSDTAPVAAEHLCEGCLDLRRLVPQGPVPHTL